MANDEITTDKIILEGEAALALWRQGCEKWNKWVVDHPVADVDFNKVNFGKELTEEELIIDFTGFNFPKGCVSFDGAQFGEGGVSFDDAQFGEGWVSFDDAQFGEGGVSFYGAQFGEGDVNFHGALFGEGDVNFYGAQFGEGDVNFYDAQFGEGDVSFRDTQFGEGNVNFHDAQFGEGNVSFDGAQFGDGDVFFNGTGFGDGNVNFNLAEFGKGIVEFCVAQFGKGNVNFRATQFGEGDVDFSEAQFGEGDVDFGLARFSGRTVDFSAAQFGKGSVSFVITYFTSEFTKFYNTKFGAGDVYFTKTQFDAKSVNFNRANFGEGGCYFVEVIFKGHVSFMALEECHLMKTFIFKGATFERALDLSGCHFSCVVDLTDTKTSNHVGLDGFECLLRTEPYKRLFQIASDHSDCARLRRLKEIAESNKDHERALMFYADEMRAKRWQDNTSVRNNIIDLVYDKLSNYGRSEFRPLSCLVALWLLFSGLYYAQSVNLKISIWDKASESLVYSASQILPILSGSRQTRKEGIEMLFSGDLTPFLHAVVLVQNLLSLMLLFLVGLALRNRFRI